MLGKGWSMELVVVFGALVGLVFVVQGALFFAALARFRKTISQSVWLCARGSPGC